MAPFRFVLLLLSLAPLAAHAAEEVEIGHVSMKAYFGAMGERTTGSTEKLTYKRDLYSDETVRTGGQSMTTLRFLDRTKLQVGQLSEVVLDSFVYDPDAGTGELAIAFGRGVFRFITGEMTNLDGFKLRTPSVAIGIRGTDFKLMVTGDGATTVTVLEGEVEIEPLRGEAGGVTAAAGQSVSVSATGETAGVVAGDAVGSQLGLGDNPY